VGKIVNNSFPNSKNSYQNSRNSFQNSGQFASSHQEASHFSKGMSHDVSASNSKIDEGMNYFREFSGFCRLKI